MRKKIIFSLFLILILIANISLASYSTVMMEVIEEPICTIELGENSKFEKRLIEKNLNNKEVTLQLQVTNGEDNIKPTGELMLVLDNSAYWHLCYSTIKLINNFLFVLLFYYKIISA